MANTKITDLSSLTAATGDEIPVNRAGSDGKITVTGIRTLAADPPSNDGDSLGISGTAWADLFLADGGVINFNAGDVTLTHATGKLTSTGAITVPSGAAGTPSINHAGSTTTGLWFATGGNSINFSGGGTHTVRVEDGTTFRFVSTVNLGWSAGAPTAASDLILRRATTATLAMGAADAASPVAQTLSVQNVSAGTSNTAGVDFTILGSQSTGSAAGGKIIFRTSSAGGGGSSQNAVSTRFDVRADSTVNFFSGGAVNLQWYGDGAQLILSSNGIFGWSSANPVSGQDTYMLRQAAGQVNFSTTGSGQTGAIGVATIELGHASDTTLARSAAGKVTIEGVEVCRAGKSTIWVPAASMTSRTTAGAQATTREINSITVALLAFDTASDEGANFAVTFPKSWNAGTITFRPFWTAASGSGTAEFELRGGTFINDAAINVSGLGTAVAVSDTLITAGDVHDGGESSAVTISNAAVDAPTFFEIIRDVSDDTLGVDAELIGIEIYYTTSAGNDA